MKGRHHLAQGRCEGLVGAVEAGSELGTDASGQFGSAQALYGVLGHLSLPLGRDGGRVDEGDPVDDLPGRRNLRPPGVDPGRPARLRQPLTCLICSQKSLVTEDPEWKVTST